MTEVLYSDRLVMEGISTTKLKQLYHSLDKLKLMDYLGYDEKAWELCRNMVTEGMETFRLSQYFFVLREHQSHMAIGECGFHTWNRFHHKAEVFYVMRNEAFKRKGLMAEALALLLKFGFEKLALHRIQACTAKENEASRRLLQKSGFVMEGTLRQDYLVEGTFDDSICYSLLQPEWKALHKL